MTVTAMITSKGQVTIPLAIRELLDVGKRDVLVFTVKKTKEVLVSPIKTNLLSLKGSLRTKKFVPLKLIREKLRYDLGKRIVRQG
jgi:AbrB family looped-hinge helix DNA binding protein